MPSSTFRYSSSDGAQITAYRWVPAGLSPGRMIRTYPRARHEVLNETNRDDIIGELISWIDRVLARFRQGS